MFSRDLTLARCDVKLFTTMEQEAQHQEEHIRSIVSENYTSPAVMEIQGSVLTNEYAEGYSHKHYYSGCEHVDIVEQLATDRTKQLFDAGYASVQPHAGSQAGAAVYLALPSTGDTIPSISLTHDGHLAHNTSVSSSGKLYNAVQYGIDANGLIGYDKVERLATEHEPKIVIAGFSAYSQVLDFARFYTIADKVDTYLFVDMAYVANLVAAGVCPNLVPFADMVTITTHKALRSPRGGLTLACINEEIEKKLNSVVFPGAQGDPPERVITTKAVCFKEALQPEFKTYQQQVLKNARSTAQVFLDRGFDVVSSGTQSHLFLLSLIKQDITGKNVDAVLGHAFITVNENSAPGDPHSLFVISDLHTDTPAVTTRGFEEAECRELIGWIYDILENMGDESVVDGVRGKAKAICAKFPVYSN